MAFLASAIILARENHCQQITWNCACIYCITHWYQWCWQLFLRHWCQHVHYI